MDPQFNIAMLTLAGVIVTAIGSLLGIYISIRGAQASTQGVKNTENIDRAVNRRQKSEPTLYDMIRDLSLKVESLSDWKVSYTNTVAQNGADVKVFSDDVLAQLNRVSTSLDLQGAELRFISQKLDVMDDNILKYGCPKKLGETDHCINP